MKVGSYQWGSVLPTGANSAPSHAEKSLLANTRRPDSTISEVADMDGGWRGGKFWRSHHG